METIKVSQILMYRGAVPVVEGRLVFIEAKWKENIDMLFRKSLQPIIISETERIEVGDWFYWAGTNKQIQESVYGSEPGHLLSKVLAKPEHFSLEQLQAIVDGKLKDDDKVLVECEYQRTVAWHKSFPQIKLNSQSHITLYPIKESITVEQFNSIGDLRIYLLNHPDREMIRSSCLHYLGDKFQAFDSGVKMYTREEVRDKMEQLLNGREYSEFSFEVWFKENV